VHVKSEPAAGLANKQIREENAPATTSKASISEQFLRNHTIQGFLSQQNGEDHTSPVVKRPRTVGDIDSAVLFHDKVRPDNEEFANVLKYIKKTAGRRTPVIIDPSELQADIYAEAVEKKQSSSPAQPTTTTSKTVAPKTPVIKVYSAQRGRHEREEERQLLDVENTSASHILTALQRLPRQKSIDFDSPSASSIFNALSQGQKPSSAKDAEPSNSVVHRKSVKDNNLDALSSHSSLNAGAGSESGAGKTDENVDTSWGKTPRIDLTGLRLTQSRRGRRHRSYSQESLVSTYSNSANVNNTSNNNNHHPMKADMVLQRYYTDYPLPLRYSHQNRYEMASVEKGETGKPTIQLFSSRMIRLKLMQNHRRQTLPLTMAPG
jgi:hypothetical protein